MKQTTKLPDKRLERVLISERAIRARLKVLARRIVADSAGRPCVHLVGVLKGAVVFMADLGREIRKAGGPPVRFGFVRARAYGAVLKGTGETTREVRVDLMPDGVRGSDVLLVEDILDQGFTLERVRDLLLDEGARSVQLCVLLNKQLAAPTPQVRALRERLIPDYEGFRIPDRWVAGYGLDAKEEFRELPYVAIVREEYYR